MINAIRITGFQSHASTVLELSPGVNYIVGPSDSGKSAIIRALRWLWLNRPLGSAFVSLFSEKGYCQVSIEADGFTITRSQTKDQNSYRVNDQEYKAFGQNPPQEVSDLLGWDVVNIQTQREQGFLLAETPAKVSAYLNSLVGLDVVDSAVKTIHSAIRTLSAREKVKRERIEELEDRLASFPDLELAKRWVQEADRLSQSISQNRERIDWLVEIVESANEQVELINFNDSLLQCIDYDSLVRAQEKLKMLYNKFEYLSRLNSEQEKESGILTKQIPDEIDSATLLVIQDKRQRLDYLNNLHTEQRLTSLQLGTLANQIERLDSEFRDKFPEVCPLCNQPISRGTE